VGRAPNRRQRGLTLNPISISIYVNLCNIYLYISILTRGGKSGERSSLDGPPDEDNVKNADPRLRRRLPPKHLDIFNGAPRRLPKPLSDQFPVRVCSCPLLYINLCVERNSRVNL